MILALIADIHGNLPALEAVFAHALARGAEQFWNLGDCVGYGPFPDEVVHWLQMHATANILGNYDQKVLRVPERLEKWKLTKVPEKWGAFAWAYDHLSGESRTYLATLSEQMQVQAAGVRFFLSHGSPQSIKEHLTPATPRERLIEIGKLVDAQVICAGHSHRSFMRVVNGKWFINPGSVGRPDDGDPRACYMLLQLGTEGFKEEFLLDAKSTGWFTDQATGVTCRGGIFRVDYEIDRTVAAIHAAGLPEDFARMFQQGLNLDFVQGKSM